MDLRDKVNAIERLARLHSEGALSDVEFGEAKANLLRDTPLETSADHAIHSAYVDVDDRGDRYGLDNSRRNTLATVVVIAVLILAAVYFSLARHDSASVASAGEDEIVFPAGSPVSDATEPVSADAPPTDAGGTIETARVSEASSTKPVAPEWQPNEAKLIADWQRLRELCGAGPGSSESINRDCQLLDAASNRLNAANICYTKKTDESMVDAVMHRCGPDSERLGQIGPL